MESIIVSDADYEEARGQVKTAPIEPAEVTERKAAWVRAEKRIRQAIEWKISARGMRLGSLDFTRGPDYTAARASLLANYRGLRGFFHRGVGQDWLKIDYLGNDVWYARSAPGPQTLPLTSSMDLEFLIPVTGEIAKKNVPALLAEGRRKQQEAVQPPAK